MISRVCILWQLVPQTLCILDFALLDYRVFGPIKEALRGRIFISDDEVKGAVRMWLCKPKTFFGDDIGRLVNRYARCCDKGGCSQTFLIYMVFNLKVDR
jgi:hypothetical protein